MKAIAFLKFKENCREAVSFYKDCFGGEINTVKTFAKTEYFAKIMPVKLHNNIQQAEFLINESRFFAYDLPPGYENDTYYQTFNPKNSIIDLFLDLDSEKKQSEI